MRILFLCTEPAGYFMNCILTLKKETGCLVKIIQWPMNTIAPFQIEHENIDMSEKGSLTPNQLFSACSNFAPDLVYVAGWIDKSYINIARALRKEGALIICGLDNPWNGNLKQRISCILSPWIFKRYFDYLWVPGSKQHLYASRLGFPSNRILSGIYTADIKRFANPNKEEFNKYLLFVGRFEPEKGVEWLFETFKRLTDEERNGWSLRMIGNGRLREKIKSTSTITVQDFMQPDTLAQSTKDAGGFILPSINEHWGVVVQEFAAAGLPLLLSDGVNASEKFLISHHNGLTFKRGEKDSLRRALITFFHLEKNSLRLMGQRSYALAQMLSPHYWVEQLMSVVENHKNQERD